MVKIKRKTKKNITKQVKKLVRKHGPEAALEMTTALVGSVVASTGAKQKSTTTKRPILDKPDGQEKKPKKRSTAKTKPNKNALTS